MKFVIVHILSLIYLDFTLCYICCSRFFVAVNKIVISTPEVPHPSLSRPGSGWVVTIGSPTDVSNGGDVGTSVGGRQVVGHGNSVIGVTCLGMSARSLAALASRWLAAS